ncbi:hypothetical protein, partial [Infirmifilum sp.]|uniref:hypothetical protein n=1 Tax=Infirmifilum sp. TaxID=2856575 RepID=UPI003D14B7A1
FLMTNLGLVYGSHISRIRKGDTYSLIVTTFIPSSEANLIDMVLIQRAFELQFNEFNDHMPALVAPLIALSFGETLYGFHGIDAIVWMCERNVRTNAQRVPSLAVFNVDKLLDAIAVIKAEVPQWPRLLGESLVDEDGIPVLAELAEAALSGSLRERAYSIVRSMLSHAKWLEREKREAGSKRARELERALKDIARALLSA